MLGDTSIALLDKTEKVMKQRNEEEIAKHREVFQRI